MRSDPFAERQNLVQLYSEMGETELYELEADRASLTGVAQEVLREVMKTRGLQRPRAAGAPPQGGAYRSQIAVNPSTGAQDFQTLSASAEDEDGDRSSEFTWKTPLCDCADSNYAAQLRAALQAEGVESWLEGAGYQIAVDTTSPRILVAADQLEQAREIASRPIPQEIAEQFKIDATEYEPPVCPKCGAEDPLLESADPTNSWLCEECGAQWTDPVEE